MSDDRETFVPHDATVKLWQDRFDVKELQLEQEQSRRMAAEADARAWRSVADCLAAAIGMTDGMQPSPARRALKAAKAHAVQDALRVYRTTKRGDAQDACSGKRWGLEDVQGVLYKVVRDYEQAQHMGGDSELLRDSIRIARLTLKDNGWWPDD